MSNRIRILIVSLVILSMALPAGAQGLGAGSGRNGESAFGWLWHALVTPLVAVFAPSTSVPPPTAGDPDSPYDGIVLLGDPDGPTGDLVVNVEAGDPDGPTGD